MKKLVYMFVAFAAISFASCGGNNKAASEAADSTVVAEEVVEVTGDSTCCGIDSCCAEAVDSCKIDTCCKK